MRGTLKTLTSSSLTKNKAYNLYYVLGKVEGPLNGFEYVLYGRKPI